ncbi:MAG TPA: hypothetical protein VN740_04590 [Solirubrobacteraceae bacterium]|nr:hypothetical protein [Solirubrobacteraceae bacterium]
MPPCRLGEAEDAAIVFLALHRARQITGAGHRVDGGIVATV